MIPHFPKNASLRRPLTPPRNATECNLPPPPPTPLRNISSVQMPFLLQKRIRHMFAVSQGRRTEEPRSHEARREGVTAAGRRSRNAAADRPAHNIPFLVHHSQFTLHNYSPLPLLSTFPLLPTTFFHSVLRGYTKHITNNLVLF
jgi:hypothetical protein